MDYSKIERYFAKSKKTLAIVFIILGCISFPIGIVFLGLGIYWLVKENSLTDAAYDQIVASHLTDLKMRAINALGIDETEVNEIEPIEFDGYKYAGATMAKKGKDNLWRTNKYEAVMLFFSRSEVHCYTYSFSTTENRATEATDVYFYKDIVAVSTTSETATVNGNNIDYVAFKLTTAGGTSVSVSLTNTSTAQRSINAMRALLKEKKQG